MLSAKRRSTETLTLMLEGIARGGDREKRTKTLLSVLENRTPLQVRGGWLRGPLRWQGTSRRRDRQHSINGAPGKAR